MNTNHPLPAAGERGDRPGFGWAGRSVTLSLWIISVLLWCVLMRQSFISMPWDDMTLAGMRLHEWKRPFAAAGMVVGMAGTGISLGCLFWLCLSSVTGAGWSVSLRRVLTAGFWGFLPGVLVLAGTVGCLTTVVFPEAARYWGVAAPGASGVRAFGVLDLSDPAWWNPAWLYVRMGALLVLAWSMAQVWTTLSGQQQVWARSFHRGAASFCMIVTVLLLGMLGFDLLGAQGKAVLSMFSVYMIAYALLASLAFGILSAVCLRRLEGGKGLSWPRMGGMLTAMVLIKAYLVYSQYLITWYASIPAEMSFYDAVSSGWARLPGIALTLELLIPFAVLLFPALRRRPSALFAVCLCILGGSLLEACWMFFPGLGLEPDAWGTWTPLVLLLGVMGGICCISFLGALSSRRVFPERR